MGHNVSRLRKSFGFAFKGIRVVFATQQNFRIHVVAGCIVGVCGIFAKLTSAEWSIITISVFLVLSMEVMNSAIEKMVDFVSPGFHEQAGLIKDISAGAVLLSAMAAAIAGLIIFLPRIL